jgi:hypothetical protein
LRSSNLGDVDMKISDRVGLEFALGGDSYQLSLIRTDAATLAFRWR